MSKIATEQEAYNIGGQGTPVANKCATNARAYALGCKKLSVADNKLVQLSELEISIYNLGTVKFSGYYHAYKSTKKGQVYGHIELTSMTAPATIVFTVYTDSESIEVTVFKGSSSGDNSREFNYYGGSVINELANQASIVTKGYKCTFQKI